VGKVYIAHLWKRRILDEPSFSTQLRLRHNGRHILESAVIRCASSEENFHVQWLMPQVESLRMAFIHGKAHNFLM